MAAKPEEKVKPAVPAVIAYDRPMTIAIPMAEFVPSPSITLLPAIAPSMHGLALSHERVVFDREVQFAGKVVIRQIFLPINYLAVLSIEASAVSADGKREYLQVENQIHQITREYIYKIIGCPPTNSLRVRLMGNSRGEYSVNYTFEGNIAFEVIEQHDRELTTPLQRDIVTGLSESLPGSVTIETAGGEKINACGWMLAARSTVFKAMLSTQMVEAKEGTIRIDDCPASAVRSFIQAIHSDSFPDKATADDLCCAIALADRYEAPCVKVTALDRAASLAQTDLAALVKAAHEHENADVLTIAFTHAIRMGSDAGAMQLVSGLAACFGAAAGKSKSL